MGDTTFLAISTWGDTCNIAVAKLTKAELKEFTTSTGSDKGERITSMLKKRHSHWYRAYCHKSDEKY
jgi:hypothetical protein